MDSPNTTIISFVFGIFLLWKLYQWKDHIIDRTISTVLYPIRNEHRRNIQGPKWKYLDGQCLDKFLRGREMSQEWRQYGPVYRIWSGFVPEVVITRPEDVRTFHNDSSTHMKSKSSNGGWLFHELLGDCMGLINENRWKQVRAHFSHHFIHRAVASIANHMEFAATEYLQSFQTKYAESVEVQAAKEFSRFPFMTTAEYLYGPLADEEKDELWNLGQESLALMGNVLSGGIYRFWLCKWARPHTFRRLRRFQTEWRAFNEKIVKSRLMSDKKQPPVVEAWQRVENGRVSTNEVLQTLSEMLFANLDVSTHVLSWLVLFLAENVDIQRKIREEFQGDHGTLSELCGRKNTLLHFCFLESARLRPFTTFTIPESSPQTKSLGGYFIPPYTSVVIDTIAINYNRKFWGTDNVNFNPHRFHHLSSTELRYNLFTFGLGTRKCLGQHFAEAMMKHFVYRLVDQYEIKSPGVEARKTWNGQLPDTWVPISKAHVVLKRRRCWKARLHDKID